MYFLKHIVAAKHDTVPLVSIDVDREPNTMTIVTQMKHMMHNMSLKQVQE